MTGQDDRREQQQGERMAKWPSVERWSVGGRTLTRALLGGQFELASTAANLELR